MAHKFSLFYQALLCTKSLITFPVEELQCLAVWKEGSSRYLVGKVHHNHATSNEDRFRCFVYEKASPASEALDGFDYRVAQSGDATCNGLFSAVEGSRTMILKRGESVNTNARRLLEAAAAVTIFNFERFVSSRCCCYYFFPLVWRTY